MAARASSVDRTGTTRSTNVGLRRECRSLTSIPAPTVAPGPLRLLPAAVLMGVTGCGSSLRMDGSRMDDRRARPHTPSYVVIPRAAARGIAGIQVEGPLFRDVSDSSLRSE